MQEKMTLRPIPGLRREDEEQQLSEIIQVAQDNLTRTQGYVRQLSDELHDLMETYGPKDKEALSLLRNTQSQLTEFKHDLLRAEKARKKPYFGRIDFKDPNLPCEESYYVGRVGISRNGSEPLVIDWRAPVASVYYESALGPCRYTVKSEGTYEIDLRRKRTYEIENDQLKDFFDSDVVANDELLTKYLAKSKKAVLGEIIATIQQEQNAIIRKSPKTNLIVQGVAGSGKTTVAMHRISYILYNYEEDFRPEDFYIIGSNRILLNYITSVLPDLDVYGISQMTMEQLFVRLLYEDWDPNLYGICPINKKEESARIKGSYEWFHDLERFCTEYEDRAISREEVRISKNQVLLMDEEAITRYLKNNPQISMQGKINMLNKILLSKLENELSGKYVSYSPAEKKELHQTCRWHFGKDEWKGSIFEVYREFLQYQSEHGKTIPFPSDRFDVYDLAALAYLYKRIKETDGIREASHVIIDEAQDFGMMAYGVLAYCLRGCTYTIMGDVSQNIHYGYGLNDWKDLQELILTGTYDTFGLLKKSYRNTVEISDFATRILRHGNFPIYPVEPIKRHGSEVQIQECTDEPDLMIHTVKIIKEWQNEGHETIAVICRDEEEASHLSSCLAGTIPLSDTNLETAEFGSGVMILPVEYTKGLEFDAVLIYNPSNTSYPARDQYVKLLYVAATRALHKLSIVHTGDLTDLIAKPVSDGKRMRSLENQAPPEAIRYQRKEFTERELQLQNIRQSDKERAMRGIMGPKPILAQPPRQSSESSPVSKPAAASVPAPTCAHHFGDIPDNTQLRPMGHSRIDTSVRMAKKTKRYLELISSYGTLRLTPLLDDVIRIQFQKGRMVSFEPGYWDYAPEISIPWGARESKNMVELSTGKLLIRIEKKTGALQFYDKKGKLLLQEKASMPRQMEVSSSAKTWVYFDWPKTERLSAKGILSDELERMNQKAKYISFRGQKPRMPLLVSDYGYGIGVASSHTVLCCDIPMYGPYLYTEGDKQIDYYFLFGGTYPSTLELYQKITAC
ncbi:MAG: 3'-5' exonuclease [Fusicatenibacter sp.]